MLCTMPRARPPRTEVHPIPVWRPCSALKTRSALQAGEIESSINQVDVVKRAYGAVQCFGMRFGGGGREYVE